MRPKDLITEEYEGINSALYRLEFDVKGQKWQLTVMPKSVYLSLPSDKQQVCATVWIPRHIFDELALRLLGVQRNPGDPMDQWRDMTFEVDDWRFICGNTGSDTIHKGYHGPYAESSGMFLMMTGNILRQCAEWYTADQEEKAA